MKQKKKDRKYKKDKREGKSEMGQTNRKETRGRRAGRKRRRERDESKENYVIIKQQISNIVSKISNSMDHYDTRRRTVNNKNSGRNDEDNRRTKKGK